MENRRFIDWDKVEFNALEKLDTDVLALGFSLINPRLRWCVI